MMHMWMLDNAGECYIGHPNEEHNNYVATYSC